MRIIIYILFVSSLIFSSCSSNTIEGDWKLASWSIGIAVDINKDNVFNENFLEEVPCINKETLSFNSNGTVTSLATFNPDIRIKKKNNDSRFLSEVICDTEGSIGFATTFEQNGADILINGNRAIFKNTTLTIVYKNAQKIYNETETEIIETKDVVKVYVR
ncbi:hypothetical protein [Aestuariibaculum sediminum]|uniref:Lipocalin-like domain-containing protein n=1 Tax=Aestuariibaculum sediminum TaxID=2770637 RepID=A0A8J6U7P8_9FLAO|nr:hypothetical protein [Aestuariibaculum sediminum]MBD0832305.1 hypothetical protein [Aestuariibaculum sediminum]